MPASTLLVTVQFGTESSKTLDLELPGDVPVGELIPLLLEICGPQEYYLKDVLLAPISLQVEGMSAPLSPATTLIAADVRDGAVLVLQTMHSSLAPTERLIPLNLRHNW